ncbi:MAG: hypothetical protein V3V20_10425 [Algisphaera sp.]
MAAARSINKTYCSAKISTAYAHVGLFDVESSSLWIAKKRWGMDPSKISHARMLKGGSTAGGVADKDRFICFWFHTPNSGEGPVHGYPIEWDEAHLLIRLDPNWSYSTQTFIPNTDTRRVEKNTDQQFAWGEKIFDAYLKAGLKHATSWHMVGPRAADSMFYLRRVEP